MLRRCEVMSMTMCMNQIAEGLNDKDWVKMRQGAHQLKGASGYVGAGRLHYVCYHIQNSYHKNNFPRMVAYYPLLVEMCIEFKRYSRRYLAEKKGKFFFLETVTDFKLHL